MKSRASIAGHPLHPALVALPIGCFFLVLVGDVALYALNWVLRRDLAALHTARWTLVFGLEILTFLALGVSGWLGGRIVFENKVGVLENEDPEATEIGRREGPEGRHPSPGGTSLAGAARISGVRAP